LAENPRYKSLPIATKKFVFGRDGNKCRYCGTTDGEFHIDHIIPRARGGSDEPSNLCIACGPCNSSKNATPLEEWLQ
jgi:5-methylcytosine-specific restriction endonuclease McrA